MQLSQDTLLAILAAVLIADVLVVFIALIWTQVQKRRSDAASAAPIAAIVPRPVLSAAVGGAGAGALGVGAGRLAMPPPSDAATDGLTGLLVPAAWARTMADEEARIRRYHRPATVVLIEIEGLERLTSMLGPSSVERIVPAVADTLRRGAREADHVARLATGRFGVLMPETDEVLAINYVERVRTACDLWLESGAVSLRLAIGWASSPAKGRCSMPRPWPRIGCTPSSGEPCATTPRRAAPTSAAAA